MRNNRPAVEKIIRMKYIFLLIITAVSLGCGSCAKKETTCDPPQVTVPQEELTRLTDFINSRNITAELDARGFYYSIAAQGNGTHPSACADVTVNYKGTLTNGATFDKREGSVFSLDGLVAGWRLGIPLIAAGGKITLYLPPSLGYGSSASGSIPGNSILIFEIDLIAVN